MRTYRQKQSKKQKIQPHMPGQVLALEVTSNVLWKKTVTTLRKDCINSKIE
jgi:hypothetical protein